jgi:hypothetical protein
MIAVSERLYLFGGKGTPNKTKIGIPNNVTIDLNHPLLETSVRSLFQEVGIEHNFEYIKRSGAVLVTIRIGLRPTLRTLVRLLLERPACSNSRRRRSGTTDFCDVSVFVVLSA